MDSTTLDTESKEEPTLPVSQMPSLYEVCRQVTDGRKARGKRYDVAGVLAVLVLAKLAGMKSVLGESRLDCRSGHSAARGVASVVETDAVCQYV
jgi:hypothetical protein